MKRERALGLSQCMIVRNEEANIRRALSWGRKIVQEQIVVDTGSKDRTREIAVQMGAKVYDFPWCDDFAAAKNFALEKASGDWVAFLDADEYIPEGQEDRVLPLLEEADKRGFHALAATLLEVDQENGVHQGGTAVRFFKRLPGIRYERRIHEQLTYDHGALRIMAAPAGLAIMHTGYYMGKAVLKAKAERNIALLLRELEERPQDWHVLGYLGDTYCVLGDREHAEACFKASASYMPEPPPDRDLGPALTYGGLLRLLAEEKREQEFEAVLSEAMVRLWWEADIPYIGGRHYAETGEYEAAAVLLKEALSRIETHGTVNRATILSGQLLGAWECLAACYYNLGRLEPCVSCAVTVLKAVPYTAGSLQILLHAFGRSFRETGAPSPGEAAGFLWKLYRAESRKDRMFLARLSLESGYGELAGLILERLDPSEKRAVQDSLKGREMAGKGEPNRPVSPSAKGTGG